MNRLIVSLIITAILPTAVFAQRFAKIITKCDASLVRTLEDKYKTDAIPVYITVKSGACIDSLSEYGIKVNVQSGNTFTAMTPRSAIAVLTKMPCVQRVSMGQNVRLMADSAVILSNAAIVNQGSGLPQAYTGKGVIVGVIDSGFDYTHPAFRDNNGNCRIQAVWDQNGSYDGNISYGYGTETRGASDIISRKRDASFDTHGTHVLGIAAGSYDGWEGVAPEADIVLVSTNKTEQGIVDGVDYLLKYAAEVGKPISINISLGTVLGYKDGNGTLSRMLDRLIKDKPGCLLAIANGNEGHRKAVLLPTGNNTFWEVPSYGRDNLFMQATSDSKAEVDICLKDTVEDKILFEHKFLADTLSNCKFTRIGTDDAYSSLIVTVDKNELTEDKGIEFNLSYSKKANEAWIISFYQEGGRALLTCDYGSFEKHGKKDFVSGTNSYTIASSATGHDVISVGAIVSRSSYSDLSGNVHQLGSENGQIYIKSGRGPTFDERIKPDVSAGGASVVSSLNSFASIYLLNDSVKTMKYLDANGRTYYWGEMSGTSMATPVVTGIMALWLQANPKLTESEAKRILKETAIKTQLNNGMADNSYGYGIADALAGMREVLSTTSSIAAPSYGFTMTGNVVNILGANTVTLYRPDGVVIAHANGNKILIPDTYQGMMIVKYSTAQATYFKKIVRSHKLKTSLH